MPVGTHEHQVLFVEPCRRLAFDPMHLEGETPMTSRLGEALRCVSTEIEQGEPGTELVEDGSAIWEPDVWGGNAWPCSR